MGDRDLSESTQNGARPSLETEAVSGDEATLEDDTEEIKVDPSMLDPSCLVPPTIPDTLGAEDIDKVIAALTNVPNVPLPAPTYSGGQPGKRVGAGGMIVDSISGSGGRHGRNAGPPMDRRRYHQDEYDNSNDRDYEDERGGRDDYYSRRRRRSSGHYDDEDHPYPMARPLPFRGRVVRGRVRLRARALRGMRGGFILADRGGGGYGSRSGRGGGGGGGGGGGHYDARNNGRGTLPVARGRNIFPSEEEGGRGRGRYIRENNLFKRFKQQHRESERGDTYDYEPPKRRRDSEDSSSSERSRSRSSSRKRSSSSSSESSTDSDDSSSKKKKRKKEKKKHKKKKSSDKKKKKKKSKGSSDDDSSSEEGKGSGWRLELLNKMKEIKKLPPEEMELEFKKAMAEKKRKEEEEKALERIRVAQKMARKAKKEEEKAAKRAAKENKKKDKKKDEGEEKENSFYAGFNEAMAKIKAEGDSESRGHPDNDPFLYRLPPVFKSSFAEVPVEAQGDNAMDGMDGGGDWRGPGGEDGKGVDNIKEEDDGEADPYARALEENLKKGPKDDNAEEVSWPAGALEEQEFDSQHPTREQVEQEQEEMEKATSHKAKEVVNASKMFSKIRNRIKSKPLKINLKMNKTSLDEEPGLQPVTGENTPAEALSGGEERDKKEEDEEAQASAYSEYGWYDEDVTQYDMAAADRHQDSELVKRMERMKKRIEQRREEEDDELIVVSEEKGQQPPVEREDGEHSPSPEPERPHMRRKRKRHFETRGRDGTPVLDEKRNGFLEEGEIDNDVMGSSSSRSRSRWPPSRDAHPRHGSDVYSGVPPTTAGLPPPVRSSLPPAHPPPPLPYVNLSVPPPLFPPPVSAPPNLAGGRPPLVSSTTPYMTSPSKIPTTSHLPPPLAPPPASSTRYDAYNTGGGAAQAPPVFPPHSFPPAPPPPVPILNPNLIGGAGSSVALPPPRIPEVAPTMGHPDPYRVPGELSGFGLPVKSESRHGYDDYDKYESERSRRDRSDSYEPGDIGPRSYEDSKSYERSKQREKSSSSSHHHKRSRRRSSDRHDEPTSRSRRRHRDESPEPRGEELSIDITRITPLMKYISKHLEETKYSLELKGPFYYRDDIPGLSKPLFVSYKVVNILQDAGYDQGKMNMAAMFPNGIENTKKEIMKKLNDGSLSTKIHGQKLIRMVSRCIKCFISYFTGNKDDLESSEEEVSADEDDGDGKGPRETRTVNTSLSAFLGRIKEEQMEADLKGDSMDPLSRVLDGKSSGSSSRHNNSAGQPVIGPQIPAGMSNHWGSMDTKVKADQLKSFSVLQSHFTKQLMSKGADPRDARDEAADCMMCLVVTGWSDSMLKDMVSRYKKTVLPEQSQLEVTRTGSDRTLFDQMVVLMMKHQSDFPLTLLQAVHNEARDGRTPDEAMLARVRNIVERMLKFYMRSCGKLQEGREAAGGAAQMAPNAPSDYQFNYLPEGLREDESTAAKSSERKAADNVLGSKSRTNFFNMDAAAEANRSFSTYGGRRSSHDARDRDRAAGSMDLEPVSPDSGADMLAAGSVGNSTAAALIPRRKYLFGTLNIETVTYGRSTYVYEIGIYMSDNSSIEVNIVPDRLYKERSAMDMLGFSHNPDDNKYVYVKPGGGFVRAYSEEAGVDKVIQFLKERRFESRGDSRNSGLVLAAVSVDEIATWDDFTHYHRRQHDVQELIAGYGCLDMFTEELGDMYSFVGPKLNREGSSQHFTWEYARNGVCKEGIAGNKANAVYRILEDLLEVAPDYDNFIRQHCFAPGDEKFDGLRKRYKIIKDLFNLECHLADFLNERQERRRIFVEGIFSPSTTAELGDRASLVAARLIRLMVWAGLSRPALRNRVMEAQARGTPLQLPLDSVINRMRNPDERERCQSQIARLTKLIEEFFLTK